MAYYAQVVLHMYDDLAPRMPSAFVEQRIRPRQFKAIDIWWVPQTVGDQVWVFASFEMKSDRDAYLHHVSDELVMHATSIWSGGISSNARVPKDETVRYWCPAKQSV